MGAQDARAAPNLRLALSGRCDPADVIRIWWHLAASGGAIVAHQEGRMLGYAILDLESGEVDAVFVESGEVDAVFVEPDAGGRGIGRQFLHGLEALAISAGRRRLHLCASLNAVPFYATFGFHSVREELYPHPCGISLRCVYMEKHLEKSTASFNAHSKDEAHENGR